MKTALKMLAVGVLVFVGANAIGVWLLPLGIVWGIGKSICHHRAKTGIQLVGQKLVYLAKALDQYGNAICMELFNDVFITNSSSHRFGEINKTISHVLGKNEAANTLTGFGKFICWCLNTIDPGHTRKAARDPQTPVL